MVRKVSETELSKLKQRATVRPVKKQAKKKPASTSSASTPSPSPQSAAPKIEVQLDAQSLVVSLQELIQRNDAQTKVILENLALLITKLEIGGDLNLQVLSRDSRQNIERLKISHVPPTTH